MIDFYSLFFAFALPSVPLSFLFAAQRTHYVFVFVVYCIPVAGCVETLAFHGFSFVFFLFISLWIFIDVCACVRSMYVWRLLSFGAWCTPFNLEMRQRKNKNWNEMKWNHTFNVNFGFVCISFVLLPCTPIVPDTFGVYSSTEIFGNSFSLSRPFLSGLNRIVDCASVSLLFLIFTQSFVHFSSERIFRDTLRVCTLEIWMRQKGLDFDTLITTYPEIGLLTRHHDKSRLDLLWNIAHSDFISFSPIRCRRFDANEVECNRTPNRLRRTSKEFREIPIFPCDDGGSGRSCSATLHRLCRWVICTLSTVFTAERQQS